MISIIKRAQDAAEKLTVRSALNPFLWLSGVSAPVLLAGALLFDKSEFLRHFCPLLIYTALLILIVTLIIGVLFALLKPEKLQSEEFQIRHQALLMFQQMGTAPQLVDASNIVAIANPAVQQQALRAEAK